MYFDSVLELYTSILSKLDNWMFDKFQMYTSLAENGEQVVVSLFTLIVIGCLIVLLDSGSSQKNKLQYLDADETSNQITKPSLDYVPSIASANASSEKTANQTQDVDDIDRPIETNDDILNHGSKELDKANIYELDNGFVLNKRNSDAQEIVSVHKKNNDKDVIIEKQPSEANKASLGLTDSDDKKLQLLAELATIETEMLDARKEYKTGKIGSMDYLAKTQELYKKGEALVGFNNSVN